LISVALETETTVYPFHLKGFSQFEVKFPAVNAIHVTGTKVLRVEPDEFVHNNCSVFKQTNKKTKHKQDKQKPLLSIFKHICVC